MCTNNDFALPWNASNPADHVAANRQLVFQMGWFVDPIVFGDYPEEMKKAAGSRLPNFSEAEKAMVKGSYDYIGLNHYTSSYIRDN
jgi:beta-glucosidase